MSPNGAAAPHWDVAIAVVDLSNRRVVAKTFADENGSFSVSLPPGRYRLDALTSAKIPIPDSLTVKVRSGEYTRADLVAYGPTWKGLAEGLGSALWSFALRSSPWEPSGDVRAAGAGHSFMTFCCASIKKVDSGSRRIAFDVVQFYRGDAAVREAGYEIPNYCFVRNQYRHTQVLRVAKGTQVVSQYMEGKRPAGGFTLIGLKELGRRARAYRRGGRELWCWLGITRSGIALVVEQYLP